MKTYFGGTVLPQVHFCRAAVQGCVDFAQHKGAGFGWQVGVEM